MTFCVIIFCQYFSKNVWQRRKIDNSFRFKNALQILSLQTSTGTRLMFLVVEKMGATAVDDELLLVFCRLVGGAVGEPAPVLFEEDILQRRRVKKVASKML